MEVDNAVYFFGASFVRPLIYASLGWLVAMSLLNVWLAGHAVRAVIAQYAGQWWIASLGFAAVLMAGAVCILAMALTIVNNDSQLNTWYIALAIGFAVLGLAFFRRLSRLFHPPL